jgi:hypothetical protein
VVLLLYSTINNSQKGAGINSLINFEDESTRHFFEEYLLHLGIKLPVRGMPFPAWHTIAFCDTTEAVVSTFIARSY